MFIDLSLSLTCAHLGQHLTAWLFCKNPLTMSYLTTHKFSVSYLLNFELSKKESVQKQASMSKNQEKRGRAENLFARAPENTEHGTTYTLQNRSVQPTVEIISWLWMYI